MANHQSANKRIRVAQAHRLRNRYQRKMYKTAFKQLKQIKDKQKALAFCKSISSILDKLAQRRIIHKNKVANSKSNLARYIKSL